ncbi:MAG: rRNA maturation RNase YbeY [Candidatus Omnitrophica bacterium]|nr:rRNA maturation RNase YbeY [Candidatus Omnitrophota bacterium]
MVKTGRVAVLTERVRLPFPKKTAIKCAEKILSMVKAKKGRVCILFTDDAGIKKLNKKYMKRDKSTDVLAFETGDIAISAETAGKNSERFGSTEADELKLYMAHGLLHLSGYDDTSPSKRKKMRRAEGRILQGL